MNDNKSKIRVFDVFILLLIIALILSIVCLKMEKDELKSALNDLEKTKVTSNVPEEKVVEETSNKNLEDRVAYLEKRLKEDNYAASNHEFETLEYIDLIAETARDGITTNKDLVDQAQKMIDEHDEKASETASGRYHIVLGVEKNDAGKYIVHTVHCEETSRVLVDFELVVKESGGKLVVEDYKDIDE
jgi:hypothetical protein